jgi:hypothetical protein
LLEFLIEKRPPAETSDASRLRSAKRIKREEEKKRKKGLSKTYVVVENVLGDMKALRIRLIENNNILIRLEAVGASS